MKSRKLNLSSDPPESKFRSLFSDLTLYPHKWTRNPFAVAVSEKISHLPVKFQESLMRLACDTSLKMKFEALPLPDFGMCVRNECGTLTTSLRLFDTTHLCENIFSNDSN
jgi:hypothetical protein